MDSIDRGLIDQLVDAITTGNWPIIVGGALLLAAAITLYLTEGRISEAATAWVSLGRGVAIGLGGPLFAGGDWKFALISGVIGLLAARGFLDRVKAVLPSKRGGGNKPPTGGVQGSDDRITKRETPLPKPTRNSAASVTLVLALLLLSVTGCAGVQRPNACVAEDGVVTVVDAALSAAQAVVPEGQSEEFDEAVEFTRGAIGLGNAAVSACIAVRDSGGWAAWASTALQATSVILDILKTADVDIPDELENAVDALGELLPPLPTSPPAESNKAA